MCKMGLIFSCVLLRPDVVFRSAQRGLLSKSALATNLNIQNGALSKREVVVDQGYVGTAGVLKKPLGIRVERQDAQ